jgi:hypothetical protein
VKFSSLLTKYQICSSIVFFLVLIIDRGAPKHVRKGCQQQQTAKRHKCWKSTRRDICRYPRNETTAVRITATAGLTAVQETTEKSGDANNSNNAKIVGDTIRKRVVNNSRDASNSREQATKCAKNSWDASRKYQ